MQKKKKFLGLLKANWGHAERAVRILVLLVIRKPQMDAETGAALEAKMKKSGNMKGQAL